MHFHILVSFALWFRKIYGERGAWKKAGLKLSIQETKIMASSPITSWQIEGEKMEAVTDFIFLSSKITANGDCSHEIKRRLLLGRKVMTSLDSLLKSRDISSPTKVRLVRALVFPVVMDKFSVGPWRRLSAKELMLQIVMPEKALESPLDSKEIKPVNPNGNQPWIFIGGTC